MPKSINIPDEPPSQGGELTHLRACTDLNAETHRSGALNYSYLRCFSIRRMLSPVIVAQAKQCKQMVKPVYLSPVEVHRL